MQRKGSKEFGEFIPIRYDVLTYADDEVVARVITKAPDGAGGPTFYGEPDEFYYLQALPETIST